MPSSVLNFDLITLDITRRRKVREKTKLEKENLNHITFLYLVKYFFYLSHSLFNSFKTNEWINKWMNE